MYNSIKNKRINMINEPRKQHFIPRFYIKEFAIEELSKINTKEKKVSTYFKNENLFEERNIKSIFHKQYLYSPKDESGLRNFYFEKKLGSLENGLSLIWKDLATDYIDLNNWRFKKLIAIFLSTLILRHPNKLKEYENMRKFLLNIVLENNPKNNDQCIFIIKNKEHIIDIQKMEKEYTSMTEEEKKLEFIEYIEFFNIEFSEILLKKKWSIFITEDYFISSDNPICITNIEREIYGLDTEGTVIYFPISPTRLLELRDYKEEEKDELIYFPIKKGHHSLFNFLIYNNSEEIVISNNKMERVINEIYEYFNKLHH